MVSNYSLAIKSVFATGVGSAVGMGVGKLVFAETCKQITYTHAFCFGGIAKVVSIVFTPYLPGTQKTAQVFADLIGIASACGILWMGFKMGLVVTPISAPLAITLTIASLAVGYFIPAERDRKPLPTHSANVKTFFESLSSKTKEQKIQALEIAVLEMTEDELEELRMGLHLLGEWDEIKELGSKTQDYNDVCREPYGYDIFYKFYGIFPLFTALILFRQGRFGKHPIVTDAILAEPKLYELLGANLSRGNFQQLVSKFFKTKPLLALFFLKGVCDTNEVKAAFLNFLKQNINLCIDLFKNRDVRELILKEPWHFSILRWCLMTDPIRHPKDTVLTVSPYVKPLINMESLGMFVRFISQALSTEPLAFSTAELVELFSFLKDFNSSFEINKSLSSVSPQFDENLLESLSIDNWRDLMPVVLSLDPRRWVLILRKKLTQPAVTNRITLAGSTFEETNGLIEDVWGVIFNFSGYQEGIDLSRVNKALYNASKPHLQCQHFLQGARFTLNKDVGSREHRILFGALLAMSSTQLHRYREHLVSFANVPVDLLDAFFKALTNLSAAPELLTVLKIRDHKRTDLFFWSLLLALRAAQVNPYVFVEALKYKLLPDVRMPILGLLDMLYHDISSEAQMLSFARLIVAEMTKWLFHVRDKPMARLQIHRILDSCLAKFPAQEPRIAELKLQIDSA